MKKNIHLLAILGTLIAGCTGNNQSDFRFSFDGLSLNLDSVKEIGVYKANTNRLGRKNSSINVSQVDYLVGYDSNGNPMPLEYTNDEGELVSIPYSVHSIEVIGEFSYIIYYNPILSMPYNSIRSSYTHGKKPNESLFSYSLKSETYERGIAWVILHNETGKLFDAFSLLKLNEFYSYQGGDYQRTVQQFYTFENKIIYFVYTPHMELGTCKGELTFNINDNVVDRVETCTSLDIIPLFVTESGHFLYRLNQTIYYSSPDFSVTGVFEYYPNLLTIKSVDENVVFINNEPPYKFVVLTNSFELLYESEVISENTIPNSNSNWIIEKDGIDIFYSGSSLFFVDYKSLVLRFEVIDYQLNLLQYNYLIFDSNLYIVGSKISQIEGNGTISILESNIIEILSSLEEITYSGYIIFSQASGLTEIVKAINLQTGEIYLESESRPTITVTQVQPIN